MNEEMLKKIGLSEGEAIAYSYILENGESSVGGMLKKVPLKRGNLYNVLRSLVFKGLVEEFEKNKVVQFRLKHPSAIKNYLEKSEAEIKQKENLAEEMIPTLISKFNLNYQKPTVRYFEGLTGIQEVLEDSLNSKGEIYSYADLESVEKYISKINKVYVKKREALSIKKKGIVLDTPFAREFLKDYAPAITETKLVKYEARPYQTVMQIYDGKISYITLGDKLLIGVIVEDAHIYEMHKYMFEYLWSITPEFTP
ncbi:MAG: helix-turn-helix domain-containing protein [bacterium]|nr:helix-turn-helix domain-containing protein [bacterium]